ncbi:MAG: DUF721 domain-containing protein [Caulobacteraceae bacterium]
MPSAAEAAEILARKRTRPVRRGPPPAARALNKTLKALEEKFGDSGPGVRMLAQRWREIVGEVLGRRTEPVKLVRPKRGGAGSLEIKVDGAAAALIQHQSADILGRVNLILGPGSVDKLRIVQGPIRAQTTLQKGDLPRKRSKGPLDAAAEAELAEGLADAPDGKLKASLLKLGREIARRGPG